MKKLSFRIRKQYFELIERGIKTVEYRKDIPFWHVRLTNLFSEEAIQGNFEITPMLSGVELEAVFICGKQIHRREITGISRIKTPEWFSDQGKKDVDTPTCLAFYLGSALDEQGGIV